MPGLRPHPVRFVIFLTWHTIKRSNQPRHLINKTITNGRDRMKIREFIFQSESERLNTIYDNTHKYLKYLKALSVLSFCLMLSVQLYLIFTFRGEQISDAASYVRLARSAAGNGHWYPYYSNLSDVYIQGNGLINLIILIFKITPNIKAVYFMNLLLSQALFWSGYYITIKISKSKSTGYIYTICFSLLGTFWGEVVAVRTETLYSALAFAAIAVLLSDKKAKFVLCGALLALANWVRPLAIVFLLAGFVYMIYNKFNFKKYMQLIGASLALVALIGTFAYYQCGNFIFQASTSSINLLMGANDDADGSYNNTVFNEGNIGYISDEDKSEFDYKDYSAYYKRAALDWIKDNPAKYLRLIPVKLFYLFSTDTYSAQSFFDNTINTSGKNYLVRLKDILLLKSGVAPAFGDAVAIFTQLGYMALVMLFMASTVFVLKKGIWRTVLPLYVIFVLGTVMTIITVGGARYHFPYLPIFIIMSSLFIDGMIKSKRQRRLG